jgi:hypothetical protein
LVEDEVTPADGVVDALVALNVPLDQLDLVPDTEQVVATPGGEVVQHHYPGAIAHETLDEV